MRAKIDRRNKELDIYKIIPKIDPEGWKEYIKIADKLQNAIVIVKSATTAERDGIASSVKPFGEWVHLSARVKATAKELGVNLLHDQVYRDPKKILKKMYDAIKNKLLYLKLLKPVPNDYLDDEIKNVRSNNNPSTLISQRRFDLTEFILLLSNYNKDSDFTNIVYRLAADLKLTFEQARAFLAQAIFNYMEFGKNAKVTLKNLRAPYDACSRLNDDLIRILTDQRKEFKKVEDALALIPSLYEDGYPLVEKKGVFETLITSADLSSVAYVDGRDSIYCEATLFLTSEKEYFVFKPAKTCSGNLYEAMSRFKEAYIHFDKRVPSKYGMSRANQLQSSEKNISNRYNYDGIGSSRDYDRYGDSYGSRYGDSYGSDYRSGYRGY